MTIINKIKSVPGQIMVAVMLGVIVGSLLNANQVQGFGDIGKVIIHWVKLIAGPILFLTVLSSILQVQVKWSHGLRLIFIAILNTSIALIIAVSLSLLFFKGGVPIELSGADGQSVKIPEGISLGMEGWTKTFMPPSLLNPFVTNEILLIALLALLLGLAIRKSDALTELQLTKFSNFLEQGRLILAVFLHWLIKLIPFAVFAVITATVAKQGFGVFSKLGIFVLVILFAFILQIVLVYGTWIFLIAKYKPKEFWQSAKEPILYAFGVNSSLATLPLTLAALKKLKVSERSASLGAGVATNLNNDGIVLYEAMAVFFIVFSFGIPMDPWQMGLAALTCIVASMGITGIPEAGFISLSVVVGVLGLPVEALPLLLAVDWLIARFRSVINVISDMTLSIAMDVGDPTLKRT